MPPVRPWTNTECPDVLVIGAPMLIAPLPPVMSTASPPLAFEIDALEPIVNSLTAVALTPLTATPATRSPSASVTPGNVPFVIWGALPDASSVSPDTMNGVPAPSSVTPGPGEIPPV